MGTFKTSKTFFVTPSLISGIAKAIHTNFENDGFTVLSQPLAAGGYDISISKGGTFKAVLGLKSALKILIEPRGENIYIEAGVGIFGQQAIPTLATLFIAWPVLIPQIWGMIKQSKLDDQAIEVVEKYISQNSQGHTNAEFITAGNKFCAECGAKQNDGAKFCASCGQAQ